MTNRTGLRWEEDKKNRNNEKWERVENRKEIQKTDGRLAVYFGIRETEASIHCSTTIATVAANDSLFCIVTWGSCSWVAGTACSFQLTLTMCSWCKRKSTFSNGIWSEVVNNIQFEFYVAYYGGSCPWTVQFSCLRIEPTNCVFQT